jgi:hypothetical protein
VAGRNGKGGIHLAPAWEKQVPSPFSIRWEGWLTIENDGIYMFSLSSDDGSFLYVDNKLVIDNGQEHGLIKISNVVNLGAGYHPIEVRYFDIKWNADFKLEWLPPDGVEESAIPGDLLGH